MTPSILAKLAPFLITFALGGCVRAFSSSGDLSVEPPTHDAALTDARRDGGADDLDSRVDGPVAQDAVLPADQGAVGVLAGNVSTVAGSGNSGAQDGPAATASFNWPWGLAVAPSGVVYVADYNNNKIRMIASGKVSTLAGNGSASFSDGPAATAGFRWPHDVAVAGAKVYVADHTNHRIRLIQGGQVSTVTGSVKGYKDGPVATALVSYPYALCLDAAGVIYFADAGNHVIRKIDAGQVSTVAGTGATGKLDGPANTATFNHPNFIAMDSTGRIFVADQGNNILRMIDKGQVSTIAGTGVMGHKDGPALSAMFNGIAGVALDGSGRIYIGDFLGSRLRVLVAGQIHTVVGDGVQGFLNGPGLTARLKLPVGIAAGPGGAIYIADQGNNSIRVFKPTP